MNEKNRFESLELKAELLENLALIDHHQMTMIQEKSLPAILAGKDVVARAKTGSGKTAAFALGILNSINPSTVRVQALVLCPTRELATQVTTEIRRLARKIPNIRVLSLCGGNPFGPQVGSLVRGAHIVVGTPGRLLKHLKKDTLKLHSLTTLVLDEADRMLDMGFSEDIEEILDYSPNARQTLLFSATYPDQIEEMSSRIQREAIHVDVTDLEAPAEIEQHWVSTTRDTRELALIEALETFGGTLNIVFCNTKRECHEICELLTAEKIPVRAIHGDLEQFERTETLIQFANQSVSVLVATDVAARGLDIGKVDVVFNYELPEQPEIYVHRIGRTGRAGRKGRAISLVTAQESRRLDAIKAHPGASHIEQSQLGASDGQPGLLAAPMTTIEINGGRRQKLRPGDLLGAITATGEISGDSVGKIDVLENKTFLAISPKENLRAVKILNASPIKGRPFRARSLTQKRTERDPWESARAASSLHDDLS